MSLPLSLLAAALASAAVLLAARGIAVRTDGRRETLLGSISTAPATSRQPLRHLISRVGEQVESRGWRPDRRLVRRLELAGWRWSAPEAIGLKVVGAATASWLMLLMTGATPIALVLVPVSGLAVYRLPDLAIGRAARTRQTSIQLRVPDLVELLVATTEAGLAPAVALLRSSEVLVGPLGEELRRAVAEMDLGMSWRSAMDRMLERTEVPSLGRLVAALSRSNRLGTPVGAALRSVALDLRAERRTRAEELARRAPVKMLFPLVFLILPAFLLLTVGPVVLATVHSLKSG
jgi:tight adherence protein C